VPEDVSVGGPGRKIKYRAWLVWVHGDAEVVNNWCRRFSLSPADIAKFNLLMEDETTEFVSRGFTHFIIYLSISTRPLLRRYGRRLQRHIYINICPGTARTTSKKFSKLYILWVPLMRSNMDSMTAFIQY
jgi:hypothetical protein